MGMFNRLFGKKRKKAKPAQVEAGKKPAPTPGRSLRSLDDFAGEACKSTTSISIQMSKIHRLIAALTDSLQKEYPTLDPGEIFSHAQGGVTLSCPNCGQLSEQAVSMLYLAGTGMMQDAVFGGPNVAALAQGRCPGCGGSMVKATFDPAKIKARNAALASPAAEIEQVPVLKPVTSYPYRSSLTVSPDEEKVAWVSGGKPGAFEIVIASTSSGSELARFSHPAHKHPPVCLFVGSDRLLVSTCMTDEDQARLTLFNARSGQKVTEVDVPDCYGLTNPCAQHDTKTIAGRKGPSSILVVEAEDDNLTYKTIETGQLSLSTGPRFGPDGELYVIGQYALYRIEDDKKVRVMSGHCICIDPAGKVYCGGGYSDRSGDSALHVADLSSGTTFDIPWGREPIDVIELAGDDHLLLANEVDKYYAGRYPNVVVTLFSVPNKEKKWSLEIDDLKPWRNPVPLSAPDEGWAIIQTGKLLKQISLQDGKAMRILPKQAQELVGAKAEWLPSKRLMYISRQPDRFMDGTLECYRIE